jgi:hypothetical protein
MEENDAGRLQEALLEILAPLSLVLLHDHSHGALASRGLKLTRQAQVEVSAVMYR